MMRRADYYAIWDDQRIIGGMIVFARGPRHYEPGRIFIEPSYQNRGVGAAALAWLEAQYPLAKRCTLDTPRWNLRTQHFYAKAGYVCVGSEGPDGLRYEKVIPTATPGAAIP